MCPEDRLLYEFSDVSLFASDESRSESQQDYFVKGDETRISKMKDYFVCALVFLRLRTTQTKKQWWKRTD